jgi:hypothetical protein
VPTQIGKEWYLLSVDPTLQTLTNLANTGDTSAAGALNDWLGDRGIPRPAALVEMLRAPGQPHSRREQQLERQMAGLQSRIGELERDCALLRRGGAEYEG